MNESYIKFFIYIITPAVSEIKDDRSKQYLTKQHNSNAEYFLECVKNLLDSTTPLAAILIGHFAMEHKGNQLLALHGYKVESHICTQIGLSRIVGRKDLAKKLSDIFTLRQSVVYAMLSAKLTRIMGLSGHFRF